MQVTIIGNGNMARGIGTRLVAGGHQVTIHAKDEAKGQELAGFLGGGTSAAALGSETADIVIIATPYSEMANVAKAYDGLAGKTVVDISNPVDFATFQLVTEPGKSGAEEVAELIPEAKVVKAFNTVFNKTMEAGTVDGMEVDVLIAGDDQGAKDTLKELIQTSGMRPLDVGPLANARHLEGIGLIHMALQDQLGTGWKSALKFIG
jgi:predicted dinucleotide-binding enzyme